MQESYVQDLLWNNILCIQYTYSYTILGGATSSKVESSSYLYMYQNLTTHGPLS